MFCKKCHKKVINVVSTNNEIRNRCWCNDPDLKVVKNSELKGVADGGMMR